MSRPNRFDWLVHRLYRATWNSIFQEHPALLLVTIVYMSVMFEKLWGVRLLDARAYETVDKMDMETLKDFMKVQDEPPAKN